MINVNIGNTNDEILFKFFLIQIIFINLLLYTTDIEKYIMINIFIKYIEVIKTFNRTIALKLILQIPNCPLRFTGKNYPSNDRAIRQQYPATRNLISLFSARFFSTNQNILSSNHLQSRTTPIRLAIDASESATRTRIRGIYCRNISGKLAALPRYIRRQSHPLPSPRRWHIRGGESPLAEEIRGN